MKFREASLEKAFTELLGQEGFGRIVNAIGSTFAFFAETQTKANKIQKSYQANATSHRK